MKKVFKYSVEVKDVITVELPMHAKPLHFNVPNPDDPKAQLFLWALVDPSKPLVKYKFRMAGTGHPIDTCGEYINTVILLRGTLVFHFFYA
jgi:hypothetical protein